MRRISSSITFFYKRVFPCLWFGFLALFVCGAVPAVVAKADAWPMLIVPVFLAVFGYFLFRALLFDLVDEVYLGQDELIVRNRGDEDRFPLSNIINVNASVLVNPERITLTLREPCKFGKEITFSPPMRFAHFTRHPMAAELIQLAGDARPQSR